MNEISIIQGEAEQTNLAGVKGYKRIITTQTFTNDEIIIKSWDKKQSQKLAEFIKEKLKEFYSK